LFYSNNFNDIDTNLPKEKLIQLILALQNNVDFNIIINSKIQDKIQKVTNEIHAFEEEIMKTKDKIMEMKDKLNQDKCEIKLKISKLKVSKYDYSELISTNTDCSLLLENLFNKLHTLVFSFTKMANEYSIGSGSTITQETLQVFNSFKQIILHNWTLISLE